MSNKTIVVLATLDTKGLEARFVCEQIEKTANRALLIDTGVVGIPGTRSDITREQVAAAGGLELHKILENPTRELAAPIMAEGATRIVLDLVSKGQAHGVISLGGTQGTTLSTKVMRALPYGFPKVMVSTIASGNVAPWVDIKDITMMFSVTDILGLNVVTRKILANAAAAVSGMANSDVQIKHGRKPLVAVTTVGITTLGAMKAVETLEQAGYDTIVFHAIGPGGRAMEQMMKEGLISAVLDYSTIEVSNEMFHALLAGGPERLTTAGKLGLPQVLCPGAIEVLVFNEPETVPSKYKSRPLIRHSPQITDVRLEKDEMVEVGKEVVRRLQYTRGNAVFLIPSLGFDSYAVKGQNFFNPEADAAFVAELKKGLSPNIKIVELNAAIDDPVFATEAARMLIALMESRNSS